MAKGWTPDITEDSIEDAVVICEDIAEGAMAEDVMADDAPMSDAPPMAEEVSIADDMPMSEAMGIEDDEDCARAPVASRATSAVPAVSRRIM